MKGTYFLIGIMCGGLLMTSGFSDASTDEVTANGTSITGTDVGYGKGAWTIGGTIGGSGINMQDLVNEQRSFLKLKGQAFLNYLAYTGSYGTYQSNTVEPTSAFTVDGELDYRLNSMVGLGFRLGYMGVAELSGSTHGDGYYGELLDYATTFSLSMIPVLGGLWIENGSQHSDFSFRGFAFAGPGYASGTLSQSQTFQDPYYGFDERDSATYDLKGSTIAIVLGGNITYRLTPSLDLVGELRYMSAKVLKMTATEAADWDHDGVDEVHPGDVFKDNTDTRAIAFDFSGLNASIGLRAHL